MRTGTFDMVGFLGRLSMNFISVYFLAFVALVLVLYYLMPMRLRWTVLLVGSLGFAAVGGWQTVLIPVLMTAISYMGTISLEAIDRKERKRRRTILACAVVLIVGALALVKLIPFFKWDTYGLVYPVGISYYAFSLLGYLADVYWKNDVAERNYFRLLSFSVFFPKILQGPISRRKELGPQLCEGHAFSHVHLGYGMQLALWGYFKKMVVADKLTPLVQTAFAGYHDHGGALMLAALILSVVQLYCDFSGCMDIAAGICQMFGISLAPNFDHPFFSRSAAEFWRRWHITLGTWFKDYVYMPIVASPRLIKISGAVRKKRGRKAGQTVMTVIPLAIVWLLTGLWHGTGLNYVVWGVYWGGIIITSTLLKDRLKALTSYLKINTGAWSWKAFQVVRTFLLFCLGRLISMSGTLRMSWEIFRKFFTDIRLWEMFDGTMFTLGVNPVDLAVALVSIGIVWAVSIAQSRTRVREWISGWNVVLRAAFYSLAFIAVLVFGAWGSSGSSVAFAYIHF